jgi:septal ring factor EnvC (AmiA/AmiB activator)
MKHFVSILLLIVFIVTGWTAQTQTPNTYTSEIEVKTKDLRDLQKALKEKRVEKERCLLEEKSIRSELHRIDKALTELQKKGEELRRQIRKARKNLDAATSELKCAVSEKQQRSRSLSGELNAWYRTHYSYPRLFSDPLDERFRFELMKRERGCYNDARNKEIISEAATIKWKEAQNTLLRLKGQLDTTRTETGRMKAQKKDLLKTTVGKRVGAEEEIKKLTESARALQQFIINLEKEKKKSEDQVRERKEFQQKKKLLPWPVSGTVVSRFGKYKHPELDTYVINNGIKIQTAAGASVKAVADGEVIFSGEFRSYGLMVIVDHGGSFYSIYGQLDESLVEEDAKVKGGGVVGKLGNSGQPSLYFEVRSNGQPEDPMQWLARQ